MLTANHTSKILSFTGYFKIMSELQTSLVKDAPLALWNSTGFS